MRVLVTGASGRIGLPLVRELRGRGHTVRALTIAGDPRRADLDAASDEVLEGDIASAVACTAAVADVDAIYHLAGQLPQKTTDERVFDVNVRGTWELMAAASRRAADLRMVVFASTNDVYSVQDALYSPVDEAHPRRPVSPYGLSKVMGEEICAFHRIRNGLPVAIARFGLTQSADELLTGLTAQYFLLSARVAALREAAATDPAAAAERERLEAILERDGEHAIVLRGADGQPWMFHICEVTDLVHGLSLFLEHPAAIGEAINLSSPAPFTTDIAAAHLAARTGLPVLDVAVPPGLRFVESIAKARSILGYDPRFSIADILDRGLETVGRDPFAGSGAAPR